MSTPNDNQRIDNTTAVFMVIVALFFDVLSVLLNFIPFANIISGVVGNGVMILWFLMKGVKFLGVKKSAQKLTTLGIQWLVEFMPVLSIAPGITVSVIIIIAITKTEDATGINPMDISDSFTQKNNRIGDATKKKPGNNENAPKKNNISGLKKAA